MGLSFSTRTVNEVIEATSGDSVGTKVEKIPLPASGWQGLSKLDSMTEWLRAKKWYVIVSPSLASTSSGSNLSCPPLPTVTSKWAADTADAKSDTGRMTPEEKRIVTD